MAIYKTLEGPALDAYRRLVSDLKSRAQTQLNLPESEIVIRNLLPSDLGANASTPDYNVGLSALTWTPIVNAQQIANGRFVGIYGFVVRNAGTGVTGVGNNLLPYAPAVEQIRITREGTTARYWNVKEIPQWEDQTGYVDDPVSVDQNTSITIEGLARTASSIATTFNIIGVVAEKRGLLINP